MRYLSALILTVFLLTIFQCGGSKLQEGDEQYASGQYTQAINSYLVYKKENPQATDVSSKIALAYFNKGKQLYDRSRNIDAFAGNYEKAQDYIDDSFTAEQKKEYSSLLYDLAIAYRKTRPNNDIQEEQYFNNTLDYLGMAIENDPQNMTADSMLNKIYVENFQKMFDKGVSYFNRAKKQKNNYDLYLNAEYYFKKAVRFDSSNEEAQKYLSDTRKETLGILENVQPLSFCVTGYKIDNNKNTCYIAVAAKNYSNDPMTIDLNALTLNAADGKVFNVDMKKTAELEKALKENTEIKAYDIVEGQLVYNLEPDTKLEYMAYSYDDQKSVKKYFP